MNDTLKAPETLSNDELRGFYEVFTNVVEHGLAAVDLAEQVMTEAKRGTTPGQAIREARRRQISETRAWFDKVTRVQTELAARIGQ